MRFIWVSLAAALLAVGCSDDDDDMMMMTDSGTDTGRTDAGRDTGGGDECEGRDLCTTAGTSCDGDTLVTCAMDDDGCLVENTQDCSATDDGICEVSGGSASCTEDPCAGKTNVCTTAGRTCDGDTLVRCEADADGCLVETETDCTATNGVCDDGGSMTMCAFPVDPCEGLADACTTAGSTCDGDTLTVCAPNAFGCLVETTTDCTDVNTGFCDDTGATTMCSSILPFDCEDEFGDVECETAGVACEGVDLVTCEMNGFGCLVETSFDCSSVMFGVCDDAASPNVCVARALDPCEGVTTCATEGRTCDGDDLEVCGYDANGCLVPTVTDCAAEMGSCVVDSEDMAVCFGDACPPATATMVTLSCANMGTPVMGDTANGTDILADYDCTSFQYPRNEVVYRFTNDAAADVTIVATRVSGTGDHDLYALAAAPGELCGPSSECLDRGTGTSATETVDFAIAPGETVYIAYDLYQETGGADTTTFTLDVTCVVPVCGDGEVGGGEGCDDMDTVAGDGCSATCAVEEGYLCNTAEPSVCMMTCGNGTVDFAFGEDCDDGNTAAADGCDASCQVEDGYDCNDDEPSVCALSCGDGLVAFLDEECDDGNTTARDGCAADCTVEDGFACDNSDDPSVCGPACGNGELDGDEECDDMNTTAIDGCAADCTVEATYTCSGEPSECTVACGNSIVDNGEECDAGDMTAGDGCSATCTVEMGYQCLGEPSACSNTCGNSTVDVGESCDGGDTCTDTCAVAVPDMAGEVVSVSGALADTDPTWTRVGTSCQVSGSSTYYYDLVVIENDTGRTQSIIVDVDWADVDGYVVVFDEPFSAGNPSDTCLGADDDFGSPAVDGSRLDIRIPNGRRFVIALTTFGATQTGDWTLNIINSTGCGDGWLNSGEGCDDGNTTAGDGCSDTCTVDMMFVCTGEPSDCENPCGNGVLNGDEQCDDGANVAGDGCSATCQREMGYVCTGAPSMCEIACPNGEVDAGETCDDDNSTTGDGCNAMCQTETGYVCNGEPSTCEIACPNGEVDAGETCDDDNSTTGDGCNAMCQTEMGYVCSGEPSSCFMALAAYSGNLESTDPTWTRPNSTCGAGSSTIPYDTYTYTNTTGASQTVTVTASWTFDGFLHVYGNAGFNPAAPTTNCIDGDDDTPTSASSTITGVTVAAGESITIVASAFGSGRGTYTITVTPAAP